MAWILLLAGVALPGSAVAHALVHAHAASHHESEVSVSSHAGASQPVAERSYDHHRHDHAHVDDSALLKSRATEGGRLALLPARGPALPEVASRRGAAGAREPPALVAPLCHTLQPRAPPHT